MKNRGVLQMLRAIWIANPPRNAVVMVLLVLAGLSEGLGIVTLLPLLSLTVSDAGKPPSGVGKYASELLSNIGLAPSIITLLILILVLMVLNMANGPKLNGPFVPLAVGAYILAWGTMGGPYDGASMNPARSFGPDLAIGNLSTWWVYLAGPVAGAIIAVGVAYVLRGPAKVQEASAAVGTPLDRAA